MGEVVGGAVDSVGLDVVGAVVVGIVGCGVGTKVGGAVVGASDGVSVGPVVDDDAVGAPVGSAVVATIVGGNVCGAVGAVVWAVGELLGGMPAEVGAGVVILGGTSGGTLSGIPSTSTSPQSCIGKLIIGTTTIWP